MSCALFQHEAQLEINELAGKVQGFYSGQLGTGKALVGTRTQNQLSVSFCGDSPIDGTPIDVSMAGECGDEAGWGRLFVRSAGRSWNGTWTARKSGRQHVNAAIGAVRRHLLAHQQPQLSPTKVEILDSRKWYPLDWSNKGHEAFRLEALNGTLSDENRQALFLADAWMVTYWTHTWE